MGKSNNRKLIEKKASVDDIDLGRFAGSSDEDDEPIVSHAQADPDADADDEESDRDEDEQSEGSQSPRETQPVPFVTNTSEKPESQPAEKMAGAMARILGHHASSSNVVLGKTITPLQRLQKQEKAKAKELKKKRQANKERNLASLHIPLSVATSNQVGGGRKSIAKELESERLHRRVATRGVVALFNAISQHQNASEITKEVSKQSDNSKMTKHGFLEKLKSTAAKTGSQKNCQPNSKSMIDQTKEPSNKWDALKDDLMLKATKNWDEESSDGDASVTNARSCSDVEKSEPSRSKRRKINARE